MLGTFFFGRLASVFLVLHPDPMKMCRRPLLGVSLDDVHSSDEVSESRLALRLDRDVDAFKDGHLGNMGFPSPLIHVLCSFFAIVRASNCSKISANVARQINSLTVRFNSLTVREAGGVSIVSETG